MTSKNTVRSLCLTLLLASQSQAATSINEEMKLLTQFLVSKALLTDYTKNQTVPLSYAIGGKEDISRYFGDLVCSFEHSCAVTDTLYSAPYAILGKGLPPQLGSEEDINAANAQIERTDMAYGADIYDAATWQIALGLAAKHQWLDKKTAQQYINNQNERLYDKLNRATDKKFQYGYKTTITNAAQAFNFRMLATNFHNKDPFVGGRYQESLAYDYDPQEIATHDPEHHAAEFFKNVSTWSDFKPITGENAWAQLIGPLQAEALANDGSLNINSKALKNAMNTLYAFSAMQAGIGGIYYAPGGSAGNTGPIPRGEISLENNFSVLGGLQILKSTLLEQEQTEQVQQALKQIDVLLNGGQTVNGYPTLGLLSFFYNGAYNAQQGIFYTHGYAKDPISQHDWEPDRSDNGRALAVDVNIWGISTLGPETIDKWYGPGTARKIWTMVKNKGGYYQNGTLRGLGYTLENKTDDIMSGEWSAGAVNALDSLIEYYEQQHIDTQALKNDKANIELGITMLRNDNYLEAQFRGAVDAAYYYNLPKEHGLAYLYASKRFAIPFGWYANPLPSTASSAWVMMNKVHFNPFQYQGKLAGEDYPTPQAINISDEDTHAGLPKSIEVAYHAGELGPIDGMALSYSYNGSNWFSASTTTSRQGLTKLPANILQVSLSYQNNGNWYGACIVSKAKHLCFDKECEQPAKIFATWSADGQGECLLK